MKLILTPLKDRVLIKPIEDVYQGTLIIPDAAEKDKPQAGWVMSLGTGALNKHGKRIPFEFEEGDQVLFQKYVGTLIQQNGVALLLIQAKDMIAIIEE